MPGAHSISMGRRRREGGGQRGREGKKERRKEGREGEGLSKSGVMDKTVWCAPLIFYCYYYYFRCFAF